MSHVTKFYMSDESRQNIDMQALIRTFDDSTSDIKHMTFTRQNDPTQFAVFRFLTLSEDNTFGFFSL